MRWTLKSALAATVTLGIVGTAWADAALSIVYVDKTPPFKIGDQVQVAIHMSDVPPGTPAAGFQAFLQFDTSRISFVSAAYTSAPFGLAIINPIVPNGNQIDVAAGINTFIGQPPSSADADLALLTFEALTDCGPDVISFRPHVPPTRLSDEFGQPIVPLVLNDLVPTVTCAADVVQDDVVDINDLLLVIGSWGPCPTSCCRADVVTTLTIDIDDLLLVIGSWGPCP